MLENISEACGDDLDDAIDNPMDTDAARVLVPLMGFTEGRTSLHAVEQCRIDTDGRCGRLRDNAMLVAKGNALVGECNDSGYYWDFLRFIW